MDYTRSKLESVNLLEAVRLPTFPCCLDTLSVEDISSVAHWTYLRVRAESCTLTSTNKRTFTTVGSLARPHKVIQSNTDLLKRLQAEESTTFLLEEHILQGNIFNCFVEIANVNGSKVEVTLNRRITLNSSQRVTTYVCLLHEIMTSGQYIWQPLRNVRRQSCTKVHEITLNNLSATKADLSISLVGWVAVSNNLTL